MTHPVKITTYREDGKDLWFPVKTVDEDPTFLHDTQPNKMGIAQSSQVCQSCKQTFKKVKGSRRLRCDACEAKRTAPEDMG